MNTADRCAICTEELSDTGLKVNDNLVSGEQFLILSCRHCGLLQTYPRPMEDKMGDYYRSSGYISHSESPETLFRKLYFFIRKITINRKIKYLGRYSAGGSKILDYGCGTGEFLAKCIEKGFGGQGLEPDEKARAAAQKLINRKILNSNQQLAKLEYGTFDIITLWHVLEHIYDLDMTMDLFGNLLKNNGTLVLAVPNYESYDAGLYGETWAGYDVPRHLYHFNEKSIRALADKYGFFLLRKKPLLFDSFFVSLLSEKQKKSSLSLLKATVTGFISNFHGMTGLNPYSSQIYFLRKK